MKNYNSTSYAQFILYLIYSFHRDRKYMPDIGNFNKHDLSQKVGKAAINIHTSAATSKGNAGLELFKVDGDLFRKDENSIEFFRDGVYTKLALGDKVGGPDVDGTYRQKYNKKSDANDQDIAVVEIIDEKGNKQYRAITAIDMHKAHKETVEGEENHVFTEASNKKIEAEPGKALLMSQIREVLVLYHSDNSPKELGRGLRGDSWFSWRTLLGLNHLKNAPVKTHEDLLQ